mmetsp:Transcript_33784/g.52634  ORF Transcript_33784/g.52634 Transcript_33784/m.52634 type:complete len:283 (-) Transcript_33784:41-889(-)
MSMTFSTSPRISFCSANNRCSSASRSARRMAYTSCNMSWSYFRCASAAAFSASLLRYCCGILWSFLPSRGLGVRLLVLVVVVRALVGMADVDLNLRGVDVDVEGFVLEGGLGATTGAATGAGAAAKTTGGAGLGLVTAEEALRGDGELAFGFQEGVEVVQVVAGLDFGTVAATGFNFGTGAGSVVVFWAAAVTGFKADLAVAVFVLLVVVLVRYAGFFLLLPSTFNGLLNVVAANILGTPPPPPLNAAALAFHIFFGVVGEEMLGLDVTMMDDDNDMMMIVL